jgi:hypothetical protein
MQMNMEIKYYISPTKGETDCLIFPQPGGGGGGGGKFPYLQLAVLPQHINFSNQAKIMHLLTSYRD